MEFRTPKQIERDGLDKRVAQAFRHFRETTPYAESRIIAAMAQSGEFGFNSTTGIRNSLIRTNTI